MTDADLSKAIEVLKDRLYYVVARSVPSERSDLHFFTIDQMLHYWPFFLDFGPLSLGNLYRFSHMVNSKLADKTLASKRLVLYSGPHMHRRANAVYLLAAYTMLYHGKAPEEAYRPFQFLSPPLAPWHDASPTVDSFHLSCLDTLRGIAKARECRFFSFDRFNIEEYEHYEKVENGDMNWIVEGRFLAFAGPHDTRMSSAEGYHTTAVDDVLPYFKAKGVSAVVRLNKKYYNEKRFTTVGIDHHDMYYLDGSNPPEPILQRFLAVAEQTPNAIAVHCKAGLGRTGTCIGAYMMKHYRFSAREAIGWMRVCRPGSVIGPQQQFLEEIQLRMWDEGEGFRRSKRLLSAVPGSLLAEFQALQAKGAVTPRTPASTTEDEASDMLQQLTISSAATRTSATAFAPASASSRTLIGRTSSGRTMVAAPSSDAFPALATSNSISLGRRSGTTVASSAAVSMMTVATSTRSGVKPLANSTRSINADEREMDSPSGTLSLGEDRSSPSPLASRSRAATSTVVMRPTGYASPGSSPVSTSMLVRAHARSISERDTEYVSSGAGAMPLTRAPAPPSISPISVPASRPGMSSPVNRQVASTSVRGGFGTPVNAAAESEYSQGDMLRSAKNRSPMIASASPGSPSSGLRFAGTGVVTTAPKSPGFAYATSGSPAVLVGSSASPSRFGLRTRG